MVCYALAHRQRGSLGLPKRNHWKGSRVPRLMLLNKIGCLHKIHFCQGGSAGSLGTAIPVRPLLFPNLHLHHRAVITVTLAAANLRNHPCHQSHDHHHCCNQCSCLSFTPPSIPPECDQAIHLQSFRFSAMPAKNAKGDLGLLFGYRSRKLVTPLHVSVLLPASISTDRCFSCNIAITGNLLLQ